VKEANLLSTYYDYIYVKNIKKGQIYRIETESRSVVAWRWAQKFTTNSAEETFQGAINVLKLNLVMVVQHYKFTKKSSTCIATMSEILWYINYTSIKLLTKKLRKEQSMEKNTNIKG